MHIPLFQRGVSLIEVMVALAIFGIGALGLAGWMALAARATHTAYLHTQAIYLAGDMAERMHANRHAARLGAYDGEARPGMPAASCDATAACPPAALAAHDLSAWAKRLRIVLPGGKGSIHCERDPGGLCMMTLRWQERGAGDKDHRGVTMRSQAWVFQP